MPGDPLPETPPELIEQFEEDGLPFRGALEAVRGAIEDRLRASAPDRLHIVVPLPWTAGLLRLVAAYARTGQARVTLLGGQTSEVQRVAMRYEAGLFGFAEITDPALVTADLVVAVAFEPLFGSAGRDDLARLGGALSGARLVVATVASDTAIDVLLGGSPDWYRTSLDWRFPIGRIPSQRETELVLSDLGAIDVEATLRPDGLGSLLQASIKPHADVVHASAEPILICGDDIPAAFLDILVEARPSLDAFVGFDALQNALHRFELSGAGSRLNLILPTMPDSEGPRSQALASVLLNLKRSFELAKDVAQKVRLWVVTRGARQPGPATAEPAACAVATFVRVAINEYPDLDLHVVDVPAYDEASAARLRTLVLTGTSEAEVALTLQDTLAARVYRGTPPVFGSSTEESRLELSVLQPGATSSLSWIVKNRAAPAAGEVEIAIGATGLNFRDVMLALGALDDDIIGAGLTGAALGFEYAGTVARVGAGVTGLKTGDRVMGFAPKAFASHVTCPAWYCFKVPEGLALEAAATLPVAFATAWYGLVECARLKGGETVLVHGAAGGVGLAAVQIALSRGARVIGTAGTAEKAALLRVLGVEAVYPSRSLAFADDIARHHGGVDVVLNSLAGEAMTASLRLLKPFGRFVELGKRDFLANTALGVRPFARNLSYHGVDLDQLLVHDRPLIARMMKRMAKLIEAGQLRPLSYRVFEGDDVGEAFRKMQAAGHVGKIVVRPARLGQVPRRVPAAFAPVPGVHVVVGGTQGFGFETAMWLVAKGAETVVVASRRGLTDPALRARVEASGHVVSEQVDIGDPRSARDLIERVTSAHGEIRGVFLTAMVLKDGLIQGLADAEVTAVLAPKVDGVVALEAATERCDLDYFVVYSSAAALIGSPGQGAYVAANAYLEAAMRNRRTRGKPGLAVAWGAIADAGVLAKEQTLSQRLQRATGVTGVPVREALDFLGRALAQGDALAPVQTYADIRRGAVADQLAILRTPAFRHLFVASSDQVEGAAEAAALIEGKSDAEALEILVPILVGEIGKILRLPSDAIDPRRSLTDLGMDSLMALELRMSIEKRFSTELPLLGIGNGRTLNDLARVMVANLRPTQDQEPSDRQVAVVTRTTSDEALIEQHGIELDDEELGEIAVAVEKTRKAAGRGS